MKWMTKWAVFLLLTMGSALGAQEPAPLSSRDKPAAPGEFEVIQLKGTVLYLMGSQSPQPVKIGDRFREGKAAILEDASVEIRTPSGKTQSYPGNTLCIFDLKSEGSEVPVDGALAIRPARISFGLEASIVFLSPPRKYDTEFVLPKGSPLDLVVEIRPTEVSATQPLQLIGESLTGSATRVVGEVQVKFSVASGTAKVRQLAHLHCEPFPMAGLWSLKWMQGTPAREVSMAEDLLINVTEP
jgi:hypothetical protein